MDSTFQITQEERTKIVALANEFSSNCAHIEPQGYHQAWTKDTSGEQVLAQRKYKIQQIFESLNSLADGKIPTNDAIIASYPFGLHKSVAISAPQLPLGYLHANFDFSGNETSDLEYLRVSLTANNSNVQNAKQSVERFKSKLGSLTAPYPLMNHEFAIARLFINLVLANLAVVERKFEEAISIAQNCATLARALHVGHVVAEVLRRVAGIALHVLSLQRVDSAMQLLLDAVGYGAYLQAVLPVYLPLDMSITDSLWWYDNSRTVLASFLNLPELSNVVNDWLKEVSKDVSIRPPPQKPSQAVHMATYYYLRFSAVRDFYLRTGRSIDNDIINEWDGLSFLYDMERPGTRTQIQNLKSGLVSYSSSGHRVPGAKLQFPASAGETYAGIDGVQVNFSTGEVKILWNTNGQSLISKQDFGDALRVGLASASFSLDMDHGCFPVPLSPYFCARFSPQQLEGTMILDTLMTTDFILKGATCGWLPAIGKNSGVQLIVGCLGNLADKWTSAFTKDTMSGNGTKRIWLDTTHPADIEEQEVDATTSRFVINGTPVKVRSRSVAIVEGRLIDQSEDLSSPVCDFLNENYTELGQLFPDLARLKELAKLAIICKMLSGLAQTAADGEFLSKNWKSHGKDWGALSKSLRALGVISDGGIVRQEKTFYAPAVPSVCYFKSDSIVYPINLLGGVVMQPTNARTTIKRSDFGANFAAARRSGLDVFTYGGKVYNTLLAEEKSSREFSPFETAFAKARQSGKETFDFNGKLYTTEILDKQKPVFTGVTGLQQVNTKTKNSNNIVVRKDHHFSEDLTESFGPIVSEYLSNACGLDKYNYKGVLHPVLNKPVPTNWDISLQKSQNLLLLTNTVLDPDASIEYSLSSGVSKLSVEKIDSGWRYSAALSFDKTTYGLSAGSDGFSGFFQMVDSSEPDIEITWITQTTLSVDVSNFQRRWKTGNIEKSISINHKGNVTTEWRVHFDPKIVYFGVAAVACIGLCVSYPAVAAVALVPIVRALGPTAARTISAASIASIPLQLTIQNAN